MWRRSSVLGSALRPVLRSIAMRSVSVRMGAAVGDAGGRACNDSSVLREKKMKAPVLTGR
jgi:hypothetical protein